MKANIIIQKGEYLGFCPIKGYLYSVCVSNDMNNKKAYVVWAVLNGQSYFLIEFAGN